MIEVIVAVVCIELSCRYTKTGDERQIKGVKISRGLSVAGLIYDALVTVALLIASICMLGVTTEYAAFSIISIPFVYYFIKMAFQLVVSVIAVIKSSKAVKLHKCHVSRSHDGLHAYCVDCGHLWYSGNKYCSNCGGRDYIVR